MDLESNHLLSVEDEQKGVSMDLSKSDSDLLNQCHDEIQGKMVIYDDDSQKSEILKLDQSMNLPEREVISLIQTSEFQEKGVIEMVTNSDSHETKVITIIPSLDSQEIGTTNNSIIDSNSIITLHAAFCDTKNKISEDISQINLDEIQSYSLDKNERTLSMSDEIQIDSDDETIATFITSAGQQLALYAVEDSDEIFAVALYDESGQPPTDFHFLMKADVEKLIGEGAVKTVKKPSLQSIDINYKKKEIEFETIKQATFPVKKKNSLKETEKIKAHVVEIQRIHETVDPKIDRFKVQEIGQSSEQNIGQEKIQEKIDLIKSTRSIITKHSTVKNIKVNMTNQIIPAKSEKILNDTLDYQTNTKKEKNDSYVITNDNEPYILDSQEELDSDAEIIEQSTVQCILCDGDISDSELTFDELQASLKSFKMSRIMNTVNNSKVLESQETGINIFKSISNDGVIPAPKKESLSAASKIYANTKKAWTTNNLLQAHRKIKEELLEPTHNNFCGLGDCCNLSGEEDLNKPNFSTADNSATSVKVKRSRKQQLTVVNRTDSEIIIQPASIFSDEEESIIMKKRGRRKKKLAADPDYNPRKSVKKIKKTNRSVEVIDLDIDENNQSNVMEITINSSKAKGSSDKENDIISLSDSDEQESSMNKKMKTVMQCTHCMRNFRKRQVLEKHLQTCSKSLINIQRIEEGRIQSLIKDKRFKCKNCKETFDIAVALARHVRVTHAPKKRGRPPKNWLKDGLFETSDTEESIIEISSEHEPEPKRRGRPPKKSIPKDESPVSDIVLKLERFTELPSEPRKRGRPLSKRKFYREKLVTSDVEGFFISTQEPLTEFHKKSRSSKRSLSVEERLSTLKNENKIENPQKYSNEMPKKRGRPNKKYQSKNDSTATSEVKEENYSLVKTLSESQKKGGSNKKAFSQVKRTEDSENHKEFKQLMLNKLITQKQNDEERIHKKAETITEFRNKSKLNQEKVTIIGGKEKINCLKETSIQKLVNNKTSIKLEIETEKEKFKTMKRAEVPMKILLKSGRGCKPIKNKTLINKKIKIQKIDEKSKNLKELLFTSKKRGRPAKEKSFMHQRLEFSKNEKEAENLVESSREQRKRGRPAKNKVLQISRSKIVFIEDKYESLTEFPVEFQNKSKAVKEVILTDNVTDTSDIEETSKELIKPRKKGSLVKVKHDDLKFSNIEEKVEESTKPSLELQENRVSEYKSLKDNKLNILSIEEESFEKLLESSFKSQNKDKMTKSLENNYLEFSKTEKKSGDLFEPFSESKIKDTSIKDMFSNHNRLKNLEIEVEIKDSLGFSKAIEKRDEAILDKFLKNEESQTSHIKKKNEEATDLLTKKKDRPSRSSKYEESLNKLTEEKEVKRLQENLEDKVTSKKKKLSPNRMWKVKKLNCADCGRWFSSAVALSTHQLQHRNKNTD